MASNKVHFKGFNAMRAFAALAVVVVHTYENRHLIGFPKEDMFLFTNIEHLSFLAVVFFFALSGFLITYLLMVEKEKYNTVAVKQFYLRRVLRIWPLYYFLLFFTFVIIPFIPDMASEQKNLPLQLLLYGTFFANLAYILDLFTIPIAVTWSVAVEEQFYLIWPLLSKYSKNIHKMTWYVIIVFLGIKFLFFVLERFILPDNRLINILFGFVEITKIDCMAIGALGAIYLYKNGTERLKCINKVYVISFLIFALLICILDIRTLLNKVYLGQLYNEIYAVIFTIVLLLISSRERLANLLENKVTIFLGNISYGIYMLHLIVVVLLAHLVKEYIHLQASFMNFVLFEIAVCIVTILVSWLSYEYFEKKFLALKKRFTKIQSGY